MNEFPDNIIDLLNRRAGGGFSGTIGLRFVRAKPDELVGELEIGEQHLQPHGLVHGGVYAAMIETLCSTGAALSVFDDGRNVVGLDNATSFLRGVRAGKLRCTSRPVFRGRRSHLWEAEIHDGDGRLVAIGRVRMLVLEAGAAIDGATLKLG